MKKGILDLARETKLIKDFKELGAYELPLSLINYQVINKFVKENKAEHKILKGLSLDLVKFILEHYIEPAAWRLPKEQYYRTTYYSLYDLVNYLKLHDIKKIKAVYYRSNENSYR